MKKTPSPPTQNPPQTCRNDPFGEKIPRPPASPHLTQPNSRKNPFTPPKKQLLGRRGKKKHNPYLLKPL